MARRTAANIKPGVEMCKDVIDQHGGPLDDATIEAATIGACAIQNCGQECGFGGNGGTGDDGGILDGDGCSSGCVVECSGNGEVKRPVTNHCYWESPDGDELSWQAAENACVARGAGWHLAGVSSSLERDWIDATMIDGEQVWFGGNDIASEGQWVWSTGEPWTNESDAMWANNQPNGGSADNCMACDGALGSDPCYDVPCSNTYRYLCELTPAGS